MKIKELIEVLSCFEPNDHVLAIKLPYVKTADKGGMAVTTSFDGELLEFDTWEKANANLNKPYVMSCPSLDNVR